MIVFCYAPPKTASSAVFTITRRLIKRAQPLTGKRILALEGVGQKLRDGNFIPIPTKELSKVEDEILSIAAERADDSVICIKTHGGPTEKLLKAVRDGRIKLITNYRHPADSVLSILESAAKPNSMSKYKSIEQVVQSVAWSDSVFKKWLSVDPCLVISFASIATNPHAVASRISDHLGLGLSAAEIADEISDLEDNKSSYGKYNKGKDARRFSEMSVDQIADIEAKTPTIMRLFRESVGVF